MKIVSWLKCAINGLLDYWLPILMGSIMLWGAYVVYDYAQHLSNLDVYYIHRSEGQKHSARIIELETLLRQQAAEIHRMSRVIKAQASKTSRETGNCTVGETT